MDRYYDDISAGYAELHSVEQLKKGTIIKAELRIKRGDRVLDIGCGPGIIDWGNETVGIDPSIALLRQAPFMKVQAVAEHLPFKDCSFEIAVSVTAMQNFTDPSKAVQEMRRVSRRVAISFLKKSQKSVEFDSIVRSALDIHKCINEDKDFIYITRLPSKCGSVSYSE